MDITARLESYDNCDCVVRKNMTCSIKMKRFVHFFLSLRVAMANETTISPTTEAKGDIICISTNGPNTYLGRPKLLRSTVDLDGRTLHVPKLIRGEKKYHSCCLK